MSLLRSRMDLMLKCAAALVVVGLTVGATETLEAKRYGLIIGTNYTGNSAGIPPLDLCERDAALMQTELRSNGTFDEVKVLLGRQVTRDAIKAAMEDLADKVSDDDHVVLYFSGHGTYQRDSGAPNGITNYVVMFDRPHVSDRELNEWVGDIDTEKLVFIFDCCYSGGIARKGRRGVGDIPVAEGQQGTVIENGNDRSHYWGRRAIVASSDANETSIEIGAPVNHGIFTYYFAQALSPGKGDLNRDGTVTVYEAFEWSKDRVATHARRFNHNQNPVLSGNASGIMISGRDQPTPPTPVPDNDPTEDDPADDPEPGPGDVTTDPEMPDDPVDPSEPEVVDMGDNGSVQILTTILRSIQAGPVPLDPMSRIMQNRRGNEDRRVKVTFSGEEYDTEIRWINEAQVRALADIRIPLGQFVFNGRAYRNQVALLVVKDIPPGVHEVVIEADGYPVYTDRIGVEKMDVSRLPFKNCTANKSFVVASLSGYGTIQGKVFFRNLETPLANQKIWMPLIRGPREQTTAFSQADGSFWFLNKRPGSDYFIKASFLESLPLDDKLITVSEGRVTRLDIVLNQRLVYDENR